VTARLIGPAWVDAIDLADWYDQQTPGVGAAVLKAVDDLVAALSTHPRLYGRLAGAPRGRELRQGVLSGFPIVFVYEVRLNEVIVVSLTHARSIRQTWRRRLP
jgi:plasmid stabilization system protein ParE